MAGTQQARDKERGRKGGSKDPEERTGSPAPASDTADRHRAQQTREPPHGRVVVTTGKAALGEVARSAAAGYGGGASADGR